MRITTTKSVCIGVLTAGLVLTLYVEAQETRFPDPVYPFGAVYFRKSNPPEQDWERDHKTAAQMGMNIFRHWFMWASIENSPGRYDWRDYDHMVELEPKPHKDRHRRNRQRRTRVDVGQIPPRTPHR